MQREDFSTYLLVKEIFGLFSGLSSFEEGQGPKDLFFFITRLLWGQPYIQEAEVEEDMTTGIFSREVRERGQFGLSLLPRDNQSGGWGCRGRGCRYQRDVLYYQR